MLRFGLVACACWISALAQTVETIPFRAVLTPNSDFPALSRPANGAASLWLRLTRNPAGALTSASLRIRVQYSIPTPFALTGLKLYRGGADARTELVVDGGLTYSDVFSGGLWLVRPGPDPILLSVAQAQSILASRGSLHLYLETAPYRSNQTDSRSALRGPVVEADSAVLLTRMGPDNREGIGRLGAVHVLASRDGRGRFLSAELLVDIQSPPLSSTITSLRIETAAGAVITADRSSQNLETPFPTQPDADGRIRYRLEAPATQAAADVVTELLRRPATVTLSVQMRDQPEDALRGQLHGTDRATFDIASPTGRAEESVGVRVHTLRDQEGLATAAVIVFDAGSATNTFALREASGELLFESPMEARPPENVANLADIRLGLLNQLLRVPEAFRMHFRSGPAVPLAPAPGRPVAQSVLSAVWDPQHQLVAPGGLFTLFGQNLASVRGDLAGLMGDRVPLTLNGASVWMAGRPVPLVSVSRGNLIAQVPIDMPGGPQPVTVRTAAGESAPVMAQVAAAAPAVFFRELTRQGNLAIVQKEDGSEVSMANPARPGDRLVFFSTGFGARTVPVARTGITAALNGLVRTQTPVVMIGGRAAPVLYSVLAPGLLGIVQTQVRMPQAAGSGNLPLVVSFDGTQSNPVIVFGALR